MDDSRSMPWALNNINRFYAHESCGQCTPCREGCPWMMKLSTRILEGKGAPSDVDLLIQVANQIEGKTVAAFGEAASWPTQAMVSKFKEEFVALTDPFNACAPFLRKAGSSAAISSGNLTTSPVSIPFPPITSS